MGPYLQLFSVVAEHSFFNDGLWRHLQFVATPGSAALIEKAGFLYRDTVNGITMYYDRSRIDALRLFLGDTEGKLVFQFKVYANSGAYMNYSEAFMSTKDALPYLESDRGVPEGDRVRLHQGNKVSDKDLKKLESESLDRVLTPSDKRPVFVVSIVFSPAREGRLEDELEAGPARYFVRFGARKTYWTYYLLGSFASNEHVKIVDLNEGIVFKRLGTMSLSDDRPALAFRSKDEIPLRQRPIRRFQLREDGQGNGKVLVRRLPVAAASQMTRQTIKNEVVTVSEIYVNG